VGAAAKSVVPGIKANSQKEDQAMKRFLNLLVLSLFLSSAAVAAGPKDYQVTGPVLDVNDDVITVQKDKEKWEIGRNKDTKVTGDLKKGSKVTVKYKMTATSVEAKADSKTKADDKMKTDDKAKTEAKKTETKTK
jgi:hypothetical protein